MAPPPRSPFSLIQEDLWPDEWKILVSCIMLNCTTRKSVEKILPKFFAEWPNAESFSNAEKGKVSEVIAPLGFRNRRTKILLEMTKVFLSDRKDIRSLPGIGEYGARTWEIFCVGTLGESPPRDHALTKYWYWRTRNDQTKTAI